MNALIHKIWGDLWLDRHQTWLTIISLTTGLVTLGTISGMIDLQLERMDQTHLASHPSHLQLLVSTPHDDLIQREIMNLPEITDLDQYEQQFILFRTADRDWQQALLIVRSEPSQQKMDISQLIKGHWPDASSLAIEQLSSEALGVGPDQSVEVMTPQGLQSMTIGGIVHHPLVKPPRLGGQVVLFASPETVTHWGMDNTAIRQILLQHTPPFDMTHRDAITSRLYASLAEHGALVRSLRIQDPEKHWGRPYLAGIHAIIKVMAVLAMLLACVLTFNTVSAHMTRQIRQIGIMKALGMGHNRLILLYLAQIEMMAFMALLLAIPLAGLSSYQASAAVLALFNMDPGPLHMSLSTLALMLACGLILPAAAALLPVLTGLRIPLVEALSSQGPESHHRIDGIDRLMDALGQALLPTLEASALSQCFRARGRMIMTQTVLVLSGISFISLLTLIHSLEGTLDREMQGYRYQIKLAFSQPQAMASLLTALHQEDGEMIFEGWQRYPLQLWMDEQPVHPMGILGMQLMAVPANGQLFTADIQRGRWFQSSDAGSHQMIISEDTAARHKLQPGDRLFADTGHGRSEWIILGTYRNITAQAIAVEAVYVPQENAQADAISTLLVGPAILDLDAEAERLVRMERDMADQHMGLDSFNTIGREHLRLYALRQFQSVIMIFRVVASMMLLVGGIGLCGTLAVQVLQRRKDIGILRSLGTPTSTILRMYMAEGFIHACIAWLISVPLSLILAKPLNELLGKILLHASIDLHPDLEGIVYWLGWVVMMALLASWLPAFMACRLSAKEAMER